MSTLLPQLTDAKIPERSRDLLLKVFDALGNESELTKKGRRKLSNYMLL